MSGGRVTVAEVLNRLVVNPTEERNVGAAKEVFDAMPEKTCVWSDTHSGVDLGFDLLRFGRIRAGRGRQRKFNQVLCRRLNCENDLVKTWVHASAR